MGGLRVGSGRAVGVRPQSNVLRAQGRAAFALVTLHEGEQELDHIGVLLGRIPTESKVGLFKTCRGLPEPAGEGFAIFFGLHEVILQALHFHIAKD